MIAFLVLYLLSPPLPVHAASQLYHLFAMRSSIQGGKVTHPTLVVSSQEVRTRGWGGVPLPQITREEDTAREGYSSHQVLGIICTQAIKGSVKGGFLGAYRASTRFLDLGVGRIGIPRTICTTGNPIAVKSSERDQLVPSSVSDAAGPGPGARGRGSPTKLPLPLKITRGISGMAQAREAQGVIGGGRRGCKQGYEETKQKIVSHVC
eukprot:756749-Hanusia_phi.AAC.10